MLTTEQLKDIELDATIDYMHDVLLRQKYSDVVIWGEIPDWLSEDSYKLIEASCIISGPEIRNFLDEYFYDIIEDYLKMKNASSISELAIEEDLKDENTYYDFVRFDVLPDVEMFYPDSETYRNFCDDYFERHVHDDEDFF